MEYLAIAIIKQAKADLEEAIHKMLTAKYRSALYKAYRSIDEIEAYFHGEHFLIISGLEEVNDEFLGRIYRGCGVDRRETLELVKKYNVGIITA